MDVREGSDSPSGPRSNFGTITSAFPPRIMQFALRFAF